MEIIVQGTGTKTVLPDMVQIQIYFEATADTQEEAMRLGILSGEEFVQKILIPNGFVKEDMKTKNFVIREETIYNEATRTHEFAGFHYSQNAKIEFDYDKEKMAKILVEVVSLERPPRCQIYFKVKDEKGVRRDLLKDAYQDAKIQATTIAEAAGMQLGKCAKVDFQPFTNSYASPMNFQETAMFKGASRLGSDRILNTFTPEEISLSESLYTLWIAE